MLPAVIPGLITVALFAFLAAWNDFFAPLILISDPSQSPLPLAIAVLRQQTMGVIDYGATERAWWSWRCPASSFSSCCSATTCGASCRGQ